MMRAHALAWRSQQSDSSLDDLDRKFFRVRCRRRLQTSGILVVLGILIAVGDLPFVWQLGPRVSTLVWCVVLLLTVWAVFLALGDMTSTRAHSRAALARVRRKQRDLNAELTRLQAKRSNGRPPSD